jgi:hypothetical protein
VITPSSNDWDYTFDGGGEWKCSGRATGSNDDGDGAVDNNAAGDSGVFSLYTFGGDFDIEFTIESFAGSTLTFGVHAIDEDATRTTSQHLGLNNMTDSFWYNDSGSLTNNNFFQGGSTDGGTVTLANGDDIKMERRSGVITVYQNGSSLHVFTDPDSTPMRFAIGQGNVTDTRYDNFKFTDHEKVQRDGFFNEGKTGTHQYGDGYASKRHIGRRFIATASGSLTGAKLYVSAHTTTFDCKASLYSDGGTNPLALIGTASDTHSMSGTGERTFTFSTTDAIVVKGTKYWLVFSDVSGSGQVVVDQTTASDIGDFALGSGSSDTITSIADTETHEFQMEMSYTLAGEPTPDHDTILLIQDEGIDGNTDFTDSSQLNLACTPNNQVHWDNVQTLGYGTTSIYVDGSDDHVSLVDHDRWDFSGDFTIEMILRCTDVSIKRQIIEHRTSGSASGHGWSLQIDTAGVLQFYANASGGAAAVVCAAISNDINYHVCAVRSNNVLGLALDGTWGSTGTLSGTVNNISTTLKIGMGVTTQADFVGWMKRIRISNVARWAPGTNFTSPSGLYPTA